MAAKRRKVRASIVARAGRSNRVVVAGAVVVVSVPFGGGLDVAARALVMENGFLTMGEIRKTGTTLLFVKLWENGGERRKRKKEHSARKPIIFKVRTVVCCCCDVWLDLIVSEPR